MICVILSESQSTLVIVGQVETVFQLCLGIGGVLTFKNAKKLKEVAAIAPLSQIVLETDCPYMAPEPNRGRRNSSLNLPYVAEALAQIKGITAEEVIAVTEENAKRLLFRA